MIYQTPAGNGGGSEFGSFSMEIAMSVDQFVAVRKSELPSTEVWDAAVSKLGFAIKIDPTDFADFSGYLPVRFLDQNVGFEFYLEEAGEFADSEIDFGDRDLVVQFTTFAEELEGQCAMVCAAGLLACCDGIYFDEDLQIIRDPSELVDMAREWISGK